MSDIGDKADDEGRIRIHLSRDVNQRAITIRKLMGKRVSVEYKGETRAGIATQVNRTSFFVDGCEIPYASIRVLSVYF